MFDLVLKGGTVIDPSLGIEGDMDVAIEAGKIAALSPDLPGDASRETVDVSGRLVMPGLVDLHAHVYWGAMGSGVEVDEDCLRHGVTTVVDAGSAGADGFPGFVRWIVRPARTRVFCFVHVSAIGLASISRAGELLNPAYLDVEGAARAVRENPELVLGLKYRADRHVVGGPALPMLRIALRAAEEVGTRVMVHIGDTEEPLGRILEEMRPGDIITHMVTGKGHGLLDEGGRVIPEARASRERGVLFDAAHGSTNFSFAVAERLLDQGFPPDAISTDLGLRSLNGPVFDLPTTMTRFVELGMPLAEVARLSTSMPARAIGRGNDFGTLRVGSSADVAVLDWKEGEFALVDSAGVTRNCRRRLVPFLTVRGGDLFWPQTSTP